MKTAAVAVSEERGVFWAIAAALIASFVLYGIFVHRAIQNVVERQALETEMSVLNTRIGELEFKYISMKNDVTIDRAYAMGFRDVTETKFVSRRSLSQVAVKNMY